MPQWILAGIGIKEGPTQYNEGVVIKANHRAYSVLADKWQDLEVKMNKLGFFLILNVTQL